LPDRVADRQWNVRKYRRQPDDLQGFWKSARVGTGMSDSTKHHNAVAIEQLQKFALNHKLIDRPAFGKLEKPRVGQRDRLPPTPKIS
jgi:hypothetical protein